MGERVAMPQKIPLSALREVLDPGSVDARWSISADRRVLSQATGSRVTYPLTLGEPHVLAGEIALVDTDWRDGSGSILAEVAVTLQSGKRRRLTRQTLRSAEAGGSDRPVAFDVIVPKRACALHLSVTRASAVDARAIGRLLWIAPTLTEIIGACAEPDPDAADPARLATSPVISVLTPVHNPPLHMLEECVSSVRDQTYPHWQLCLIDDGSSLPEVVAALRGYVAEDPRITLERNERAQGIAAATNQALAMAQGEYVALLDHDDWLESTALERVAQELSRDPGLDMVYTDEDIVMDGRPIWVHHKQAWSPDVLRTNGYTCHLGVYRRRLVEEIGCFRSEFDGSQDVDMILRLVERTDRIAHVPEILYHWRAHAASTAGGDAKPYAYVSARNAIGEHLRRTGIGGHVDFGPPGLYRVVHDVDPELSVGVALSVDTPEALDACAESLLGQAHGAWTLTLAAAPEHHRACLDVLIEAGVEKERVEFVVAPTRSPSVGLALAAARAAQAADYVLVLQAPPTALTHGWLSRLLGYAHQPGIGVAGPVSLAPDGRITDSGVALVDGVCLNLLYGLTTSMDLYFGFGTSAHNVSAVRAAAMTPAALLREVGLRAEYGDMMIVDYCLSLEPEHRVVTVPDVRLTLDLTPDNDLAIIRRLGSRTFGNGSDPFYNPHYRTDRGDFAPLEPLA